MAPASFSTLPVELKARIVEMTSDQEDAYKDRVDKHEDRVGHVNGLSALALVNKELGGLAAVHQFKVVNAKQASFSIFRYRIVPRHGHRITELSLMDHHDFEGAEHALSAIAHLPALRTIAFGVVTAQMLFGLGVTLSEDLEDEDEANRAAMLNYVAAKIETLVLHEFSTSDAVGLVRACSNLMTLGLLSLREITDQERSDGLARAISSLARLNNLSISFDASSTGRPLVALEPLEANPPPVKCLQLGFIPFNEETFRFVSHFSSTIETLTLELKNPEDTPIPSLDLPHLTNLYLSVQQLPHFEHIPRILLSSSTLSRLSLTRPAHGELDLAEPALVRVLASQPALRWIMLGGHHRLSPLPQVNSSNFRPSPSSPSSLAAYSRLIHSSGRDPSVLDRPHLTPFHPEAILTYTEDEAVYLEEVIGATLDFGRIELKRMLAEGSVASAVEWLKILKPLEEKRLTWKD